MESNRKLVDSRASAINHHPDAPGETGLHTLMNVLGKRELDQDNMDLFVRILSHHFNLPVPLVCRNNRLTATYARYLYRGTIEMGLEVDDAGTLAHEFAHHLQRTRHGYQNVSHHGWEFNQALQQVAIKAIEILGLEMPGWKPVEVPQFHFKYGQRVQVNPTRKSHDPFIGTVWGFTRYKVRIRRDEPGHPKDGWYYDIPPRNLADATVNPEDFKLDLNLDDLDLEGLDLDL